nr:hypothetical protein [uncultured Lachnoanaerobaculum sp.]
MIFKIDKSCLDAIDLGDEDAIAVLEQLALHRRAGKNYIFAEKGVLEKLMVQKDFSRTMRTLFKSLYNNSSEDKLYLKSVNKYINMVYNKTREENKIEIVMELTSKNAVDICDTPVLITENQEDALFYELIAKYYTKCNGFKNMEIFFESKPGGGDTTAKVLKQTVNTGNRLCLCIVDSDKKFPDDSGGDTKKHVEDFTKCKTQDIWKAIILDVHEVENLIPIGWIEKCSKENGIPCETISFLKYLKGKVAEEKNNAPIYYFDIKKGIKKDKFVCADSQNENIQKEFNKSECFRNYWSKHLKGYGIDLNKLEEMDGKDIIQGVDKRILNKILGKYKNIDIYMVNEEHLKDKWLSLGRDIFSWGCVGGRIN